MLKYKSVESALKNDSGSFHNSRGTNNRIGIPKKLKQ